VSQLYHEELRGVGLRTTQYSLMRQPSSAGKERERDLGGLTTLDKTTLTRNLRLLIDARWLGVYPGEDRREQLVRMTEGRAAKLKGARAAREQAQERLRSRLPEGNWSELLDPLPEVSRLAATT
jgi:DNA-binding MarR family transcriptional regulator